MKIEERRFVAFDYTVVDVNAIVAIVGGVKKIDGLETEVFLITLETGTFVTLLGAAKDQLEFWWKENMIDRGLSEKIELPEPIAAPITTPVPVVTPSTAVPVPPEPATAIPNIVAKVTAEVSPTPPPQDPVVKPPSLSDIGKT